MAAATRQVQYVGGPLDGEAEVLELVASPDGTRHALPGRLTVPVTDRPDFDHAYALDQAGTRYRYQGYAPA